MSQQDIELSFIKSFRTYISYDWLEYISDSTHQPIEVIVKYLEFYLNHPITVDIPYCVIDKYHSPYNINCLIEKFLDQYVRCKKCYYSISELRVVDNKVVTLCTLCCHKRYHDDDEFTEFYKQYWNTGSK